MMNYKEFLYRQAVRNLNNLDVANWIKNIAKKRLDDYFKDSKNDLDLELIFQELIADLKEVVYP
jgi:hypothetical protein